MDWMCFLYYVLACLGGAVLSWLIFNNNGKLEALQKDSANSKADLNKLLLEFKAYREDSKAKIYTKDAEISLLKKKMKSASNNEALAKELTQQKTKYRTLQNKLLLLETTRPDRTQDAATIKKLKSDLKDHMAIVEDKNSTIKRMQANLITQNPSSETIDKAAYEQNIKKQKKQLKRLQKKYKKLKSQSTAETLDIDKLITLLKKGDLTKRQ